LRQLTTSCSKTVNNSGRKRSIHAKTGSCLFVLLLFVVVSFPFFPLAALADQQTISVGYGTGTLNNSAQVGHLWGNDYYDFALITYGYEKTLSGKFNLVVEPFLGVVNRPASGVDLGFTVGGRYYFGERNHRGLFATVSGGGVYTTVKFEEQGTHDMFVLQGGLGYKWEKLFVEGKFRHYSNGGLSHPNRSVNATIVSVGYAF
jgi:hypothetical protein